MSNRSDIPFVEQMGEYYEGMPADWPMMPAVCTYAPLRQDIVCFCDMS